jgi:regulator of CtrA degradation
VFSEGMAMVEKSAAYLDGDGRRDAKALPSHVTVLYATESMRLTTRLLELASWLMIRRALKEGEITADEAKSKRERVKLRGPGRTAHVRGFADLPEGLRQLIDASFALSDRIFQLDRAMEVVVDDALPVENPVGAQVSRLEEAFSKPRRLAGR